MICLGFVFESHALFPARCEFMHNAHHITKTLGRIHAFLFLVFIGCFATDAAAESRSTFLFAQGSCLDDLSAPYSTPATTFNPVIFTMSISQEMETRPEDTHASKGAQDEGCDKDEVFAVENECLVSSNEKHGDAEDAFDGFVLASTVVPPAEPTPSRSCFSSGSKDRCESEPPLPILTVIDISTASGWVDAFPKRSASRELVMRVRGHSARVLTTLKKQPASLAIEPHAPPPRAA